MSSFAEALNQRFEHGNERRISPVLPSLEDIFEEEPVDLTTFVQDKAYLGSPPLSLIQYDAVKHIERVYLPSLYPLMAQEWPYWAEPVRMTNLITLQFGKGSGKDLLARFSSLRIAYLLLCLKTPQEYFGMPEQDTIHMLNIASSAGQASVAYFSHMTKLVKRGWFKDRSAAKQAVIVYDKNVEAHSGHSEAESQEGLNLILGVADEIDAFKTRDEVERFRGKAARESSRSAEYILSMLKTSASTRFPETYKMVSISYPRYLGSTIQRLTDEGKTSVAQNPESSIHYVSGPYKTWEVNPRYDKYPRVAHPNTDCLIPNLPTFVEDYDKDPKMAKAKYECLPSRSIDSYFKNFDMVRHAVTEDEQPLVIDYELVEMRSEITGKIASTWNPTFNFSLDFLPIAGAKYCIHADLAITGDRAGVSMSHVLRWENREVMTFDKEGGVHERIERLPVVKNDFTVAFESSKMTNPQRDIQIRWVRMLVFELIRRGFHIASISFDSFQSTDAMQLFALHSIDTKKRSTDTDEIYWKSLKDLAYEGRLLMPFSQLLLNELEALGRLGGKIDHPPSGSKDLADALAVSVAVAIEYGGSEVEDREVIWPGSTEFILGESQALEFGYESMANPFAAEPELGYMPNYWS